MKNVKKYFGSKQVVLGVLISLVIVAGIMNYLTNSSDVLPTQGDLNETVVSTLEGAVDPVEIEKSDYFAQVAFDRDLARGKALEILETTSTNSTTQEERNNALSEIKRISDNILLESQIESLIISKGYEKCVVYINEGIVSVVVKAQGLDSGSVSQIKDIVVTNSGIPASGIRISEYF